MPCFGLERKIVGQVGYSNCTICLIIFFVLTHMFVVGPKIEASLEGTMFCGGGVEIKAKDFSIEMSNMLFSLLVEHDLTFIQFKVPHHTSLKFNSEFTPEKW